MAVFKPTTFRRFPLLLAVFALVASRPALGSTVVCSMPATFSPGVSLMVTDSVSADSSVFVYAVEDGVPADWTVASISDDGTFDATNHTVKWGPFFDNLSRALTYTATPPANAKGIASFAGDATFNLSGPMPIAGQRSILIEVTGTNTIICSMPATFVPGAAFDVTNTVSPASGVFVYAVQDQIPAGWSAFNISDGGSFDPITQSVKWGPFFDGAARQLTYVVTSPSNAVAVATFAGSGDFSGTEVPITGQRQVQPVLSDTGSVVCSFPSQYTPGQWFTVTNLALPGSNVTAFAVEDGPPPGWVVTNISNGGTYDMANSKVQWGPFFMSGPLTLTYSVLPTLAATGTVAFAGTASFDNFTVLISGQRQAVARPVFYGSVICELSSTYVPGEALMVTNLVTPGSNITAFAGQDFPPASWTVSLVNDGGVFDSATHSVKWGPFLDGLPRTLTYQVTPPTGASGTATFDGEGFFDSNSVAITGQRQTTRLIGFTGSVVSSLPASFAPGTPFTVTDVATPPTNTMVYAVEDIIPSGWTATNISDGGVLDAANSVVKWGPFFDNLSRSLAYQVISPANAFAPAVFEGTASFDTNTVPITGQRQSLPNLGSTASTSLAMSDWTRSINGQFQFDFTNSSGQSVVILAATNPAVPLSAWTVLGSPTLVGGNLYRFVDSDSTNHPQRFYRLRSP